MFVRKLREFRARFPHGRMFFDLCIEQKLAAYSDISPHAMRGREMSDLECPLIFSVHRLSVQLLCGVEGDRGSRVGSTAIQAV